ncbi:MAG: glycosyltransferase family 2 protein [Deltaproteobacteria bacterium]|nr:glycosyltransferase family 2 protein [Deltaproteobacteria bacterium]
MKLSVIICVFNEKDTILEILERVQRAELDPGWEKEIIIVDNVSTDGTRELLKTITAHNVRIVLQKRNLGKGNSIRTAIPLCTGDYTIMQDADLEYHPRQYRLLLRKALDEGLDAVYGSRVLGDRRYHHYAVNYWAVRFLTFLTNLLFGSAFTDVATNYKLVRTALLQSLDLHCCGFDLDFEISNKLARRTKKIAEVPITFEPRTYEQGKKINAADGLKALAVILRNRLFC